MSDKTTAIMGVLAGLVLAGTGLTDAALRGVDLPKTNVKTLTDGQWASGFGTTFDKQLPLRDTAVNGWTLVSYSLFHEARDGVLVGDKDWLYTSEEFNAPRIATGVPDALRDAASVNAALSARGIRLLVAVVPAKARIYPENLGRYRWPSGQAAVYDKFVSGLRAEGIPTVDLRGTLSSAKSKGLAYFRTDTHWTPVGAQMAAQTIATDVRTQQLLSAPATVNIRVSYLPPKAMDGDLLNFIPLGQFRDRGPKADTLTQPSFAHVEAGDGQADAGLLGDSSTPVLLVGSSYSADERWGFADFLSQSLGVDLVNASEKGQGPFVPMHNLLKNGTLDEAQPQLVIWEIPERYIWMNTMPAPGSATKQ